jgi:hypothetical protein
VHHPLHCYGAEMTSPNRPLLFHGLMLSALLVGCGDGGGQGVGADSAVCGTHEAPGILTLSSLKPAKDASVVNQTIVHSFTVLGAPADYRSFQLVYGDGHTAGLSTPADPKFQTTLSGSNVIYQLVIDRWAYAPGHVVLNAKGSFDTMQGCTWAFPSPLFSYDITPAPGLDGGPVFDSKPAADAADMAIDASAIDVLSGGLSDLPMAVDLSSEALGGIDAAGVYDLSLDLDVRPSSLDASPAIDGV